MTTEEARARIEAWNLLPREEKMAAHARVREERRNAEPTLIDKAKSFTIAVVAQAKAGNPKVTPEVAAERKAICFACPLLDISRDVCSKCGCSAMELKRSWATSECPDSLPRWLAV